MKQAIQAAIDHAKATYPRECGGFIVKADDEDKFLPTENISDKKDRFRMDKDEYAKIHDQYQVVGFVHSHPNGKCEPSQADMVAIETTAIPWLIISYNPGVGGDEPRIETKWFQPSGFVLPLLGRTFAHGVIDCYTAIKDHYKQELNIEIPDFERRDDWWNTPDNLYLDNFEKAGFVAVNAMPEKDDVLLMNIQTPAEKPCHAAVYLGGNVIYHHLPNRLSGKDVYGGYYQRHTVRVLRHRTKC